MNFADTFLCYQIKVKNLIFGELAKSDGRLLITELIKVSDWGQ
jgi:hypothetical protein